MLDFVLFIILSVLESSALFYLGFKLFKIDLYSKEIIFAGIIMAFFLMSSATITNLQN